MEPLLWMAYGVSPDNMQVNILIAKEMFKRYASYLFSANY